MAGPVVRTPNPARFLVAGLGSALGSIAGAQKQKIETRIKEQESRKRQENQFKFQKALQDERIKAQQDRFEEQQLAIDTRAGLTRNAEIKKAEIKAQTEREKLAQKTIEDARTREINDRKNAVAFITSNLQHDITVDPNEVMRNFPEADKKTVFDLAEKTNLLLSDKISRERKKRIAKEAQDNIKQEKDRVDLESAKLRKEELMQRIGKNSSGLVFGLEQARKDGDAEKAHNFETRLALQGIVYTPDGKVVKTSKSGTIIETNPSTGKTKITKPPSSRQTSGSKPFVPDNERVAQVISNFDAVRKSGDPKIIEKEIAKLRNLNFSAKENRGLSRTLISALINGLEQQLASIVPATSSPDGTNSGSGLFNNNSDTTNR